MTNYQSKSLCVMLDSLGMLVELSFRKAMLSAKSRSPRESVLHHVIPVLCLSTPILIIAVANRKAERCCGLGIHSTH